MQQMDTFYRSSEDEAECQRVTFYLLHIHIYLFHTYLRCITAFLCHFLQIYNLMNLNLHACRQLDQSCQPDLWRHAAFQGENVNYRPVIELYLFLVINGHKYMFPSYFELKVSLYWKNFVQYITCNRNSVTKVYERLETDDCQVR